jgi:hypothetical protein
MMAYPANIQLNLDNDQAGQVIQQNVPAGAQTALTFKVEQLKVPDYWGQKAKDTVTAIVFVRKIDDLARTNNRKDTTAYTNVANSLKGFARDWLFATADMLDWTEAQLTWTNLKPRFQKQFATQTDDNQIIDGLSNFGHGTKRDHWRAAGQDHQHNGDHQGELRSILQQSSGTSYRRTWAWTSGTSGEHGDPMVFKMQLFRASLPGDLRKAVAQHDQTTPNQLSHSRTRMLHPDHGSHDLIGRIRNY